MFSEHRLIVGRCAIPSFILFLFTKLFSLKRKTEESKIFVVILCCYKYKRNQICKFDLEKVLSSPSLSRSKKISHLMENQCAKVAVMENRHIHIDTWRDLVQFVLAFIPNACVFLSELFFPFRSESRTETLRNDSILSHSIYMFEQTF